MSLYVVATPIGHHGDLSSRALELIKSCDFIIGEEKKELDLLLRRCEAVGKPYALLNEHSKSTDVQDLLKECRTKKVVLVSDCGTPAFCDPGSDLVGLCRKEGVEVHPIPGASSLMAFLSVSGQRLQQFHFEGFLPRENEERKKRLEKVMNFRIPVILMDTPYRLKKLLEELATVNPAAQVFLGCDLTQETEWLFSGKVQDALSRLPKEKAEFLLMTLPSR